MSVVANPAYIPPFDGIQTMQEMTADICNRAAVGDTTRLVDIRDNNTYAIAKLPDNNCWMTQNLQLSGGTELTLEDSNVADNWSFFYPQMTMTQKQDGVWQL